MPIPGTIITESLSTDIFSQEARYITWHAIYCELLWMSNINSWQSPGTVAHKDLQWILKQPGLCIIYTNLAQSEIISRRWTQSWREHGNSFIQEYSAKCIWIQKDKEGIFFLQYITVIYFLYKSGILQIILKIKRRGKIHSSGPQHIHG